MKKSFLLISFCALAVSASAQFKVLSNGNVSIQNTSTSRSISFNGAGSGSYYVSCNSNGKSGISLTALGTGNMSSVYGGDFFSVGTSKAIGLRGFTTYGTTNIGVMGETQYGTKSIGILGTINDSMTTTGAGVYGSVKGDIGSYLTSGQYAGFFKGDVKVVGTITASTTLQGALLGESSSESGSSSNGSSLRSASIAGSLSGLSVTTYQKERTVQPEYIEVINDTDGDIVQKAVESEPDIMDEQFYGKTHYALDADRLEETFPDLVYVNKDGSKVINYVEMIPLLVQSINELSAEIEVLKGQTSEETARKARSATNVQKSLSGNRLYQNTPNPFKEQTIIRFSLADDVQDASICIFDMTGKTIRKLPVSSGMNSVSVGGYELGEGMFLYSLIVNGQEIDTKRMIISK